MIEAAVWTLFIVLGPAAISADIINLFYNYTALQNVTRETAMTAGRFGSPAAGLTLGGGSSNCGTQEVAMRLCLAARNSGQQTSASCVETVSKFRANMMLMGQGMKPVSSTGCALSDATVVYEDSNRRMRVQVAGNYRGVFGFFKSVPLGSNVAMPVLSR